ncbi:hypothetical protein ACI6PS_03695 [Flavobacterium sp. PLA-1-15]|uniref:hypothetical protein n=1 Tax=Flavobacterium sp. PLA-1-15 TaxID=3380533 RepID=UPI003B79C7F9
MSKRILLPNGCSCSTPSVNPKNWKTCNKSALQKDWQIQYYFYDPEFPKPKRPIVVKGMNSYHDLKERREITQALLDDELKALKELGYNPYTKKYNTPQDEKPKALMNPDLLIVEAFRLALSKKKASDEYLDQIRYAVNRFEKAAKQLRMDKIRIYDLRRSQLKEIFDYIDLTDDYFNKYKAYFSALFIILVEYECCETNLTRDIQKRTVVKKQREVLELNYLDLVLEHLKEQHYSFYRYGKIFFYSGARTTELFTIQKKHVRLEKQEYDVLIKKGSQYVWETKIIIQNAIPFWEEIMKLSHSKDDYLFSHGLIPGATKNCAKQITIRWRTHVKKKLVFKDGELRIKSELDKINDLDYERITADFYAMKHNFLDLLDSKNDDFEFTAINTPKEIASHRTDKITHGVYTGGKQKRINEKLKAIRV